MNVKLTQVTEGIKLAEKKSKQARKEPQGSKEPFAFRIKMGEYELEIRGTRDEVTKTVENLQSLVDYVQKAFEAVKPKTVATITVKTEPPQKSPSDEAAAVSYPKIGSPRNCEDAVLRILETDWGKWRPRTMEELKEIMKSNGLKYTSPVLEETLNDLADKGMVRRWNTTNGFVYILAEKKNAKGEEKS